MMPDHPQPKPSLRRLLSLAAAIVLVMGLVAGAALLSGQIAYQRAFPDTIAGPVQATAVLLLTPAVSPFAPLDPAIIPVLEQVHPAFEPRPLTVLEGVIPVGVYMPGWGQDVPPALQPIPTVVPFPTVPAIEQVPDGGILPTPTVALSPLGGPAPQPYAGGGCAPSGLPTGGLLTQRFHQWHSGVDYGIPIGTPVQATHSGRVTFAGWSTVGYGNLVILQNGSFITYYAHLNAFNVIEGQYVGAGSILAWSGTTGNSTGPHIHYEVRINNVPVDPLTFGNRGYPTC